MKVSPSREAIRKALVIDCSIAIVSIAPAAWMMARSEAFTLQAAGVVAFLYIWTMLFCITFGIRHIRNWGLRFSAIAFSSGFFVSSLVISALFLPPLWAVGAVPIATYFISRMRMRHYLPIDLKARIEARSLEA